MSVRQARSCMTAVRTDQARRVGLPGVLADRKQWLDACSPIVCVAMAVARAAMPFVGWLHRIHCYNVVSLVANAERGAAVPREGRR